MAVTPRRLRALAPATFAALALTACWPVPGGNADRTAHNPFESALTPATVTDLEPVWELAAHGNPVVSGGRVFVTDGLTVRRLNLATGATVWSADLPHPWPEISWASDPFVGDDGVLVGYGAPNLGGSLWAGAALDPDTGAVDDTQPFAGIVESLRGQRLVATRASFGSGTPAVFDFSVIDLRTGQEMGGGYVAVSQGGGERVDFTLGTAAAYESGVGPIPPHADGNWTQGDAVRAYPLRSGVTCGPDDIPLACANWTTEVGGLPTAPVLGPAESTVHVGTDAGDLVALDAATGDLLWSTPLGAAVSGPPALAGGVLYAGTAGGALVAVDAASGNVLWSAALGSAATGQPAVAGSGGDAIVFVGTSNGVAALPAAGCGGAVCPAVWSADVAGGAAGGPVVSGGHVLVTTGAGRLVAYALPST
jgi:hypothetical protein